MHATLARAQASEKGDRQRGRRLNRHAENPIETLAARIQSLPPSVRWLYAQSDLIEATALGWTPERGPWSRISDHIMALSSRLGLARIVAAIVNLVLLAAIYARQHLARPAPAKGPILVGIKALREPELVRQLGAMQGAAVVHLDERRPADFFRQRVPLSALLREMGLVWCEVWEHLSPSRQPEGLAKVHLLSFLLMRGHRLAHMRAWLRRYRSQGGAAPAVAWTSASYLAHAPVAVGLETIHMEHGFQRRSLIYPDFARSVCFNAFDAEHMRRRLPRCAVTLIPEPARFLPTRRVVAVAGTSWEPDGFDLIRPFIAWALRSDLPVVVRKHPVDTSDYWEQWRGDAGVEITDGQGSFIDFLERFQPRLLASWFSTALFDALARGIVPVTVTPESHEAALDTVFPFRKLSLCWPEHESIALKLLDDDRLRAEFLAKNYARAMGALPFPPTLHQ